MTSIFDLDVISGFLLFSYEYEYSSSYNTVVSYIVFLLKNGATLRLRISVTAERIGTKPVSSKSRPLNLQKTCGSLLRHSALSRRNCVTEFLLYSFFLLLLSSFYHTVFYAFLENG